MNKIYSFRLLLDDDLREKLDSMTGKERSSYIREALRFYYKYGEELKKISENVSKIVNRIDEISINSPSTFKAENQELNISGNEEMLLDSIKDILDL